MGAITAALFAGTLAVQTASGAMAGAGVPCPAGGTAEALPPEYAGWSAMQGVTAGTGVAAPATLAPGRSARATLVPVAGVSFPAAPEHAAEPGTSAGVFAFDVAEAGSYRVALGATPWVDVVSGGKALPSIAHGHGPDCSGIRKYVDYRLTPGRYLLQVSGSRAAVLVLMVARVGA